MCEKIIKESFTQLTESNGLSCVKVKIEKEIEEFIEYAKTKLSSKQRIFSSVESRIKGEKSFSENLTKKYLHDWESEFSGLDEHERVSFIAKKLPDLIGYRINCFFKGDEKIIYDILHDYYKKNSKLSCNITLSFGDDLTQTNGHTIYKLKGEYHEPNKNIFCFEIQIKSIIHNMWGEVEHETIYKNKYYNSEIFPRKKLLNSVFTILEAADNQLVQIFDQKLTDETLHKVLFFNNTQSELTQSNVMAKHYESFFIFFEKYMEDIQKYNANKILNSSNSKKIELNKIQKNLNDLQNFIVYLSEELKKDGLEHDIKCIYLVAKTIFNIEYKDFIDYIAEQSMSNSSIDEDFYEEDFCSDESDDPDDDSNDIEGKSQSDVQLFSYYYNCI